MSDEQVLSALRRVEQLERIVKAQQTGLPAVVSVLVYSDDQDLIEEAINAKLGLYGLSSTNELKEAGSHLEVVKLPYCFGRAVDKDCTEAAGVGPDIMRQMKEAAAPKDPIIGSYRYLHKHKFPGYQIPLDPDAEGAQVDQRIMNTQASSDQNQEDKAFPAFSNEGTEGQRPVNAPE